VVSFIFLVLYFPGYPLYKRLGGLHRRCGGHEQYNSGCEQPRQVVHDLGNSAPGRKAIHTVSYERDISVQPLNGLPPALPATQRHYRFKSLALVPGPAQFSFSFLEKFRVGNWHPSAMSRLSTSPLMSDIKNCFFQKMCFK
jgi:hypothetical protein